MIKKGLESRLSLRDIFLAQEHYFIEGKGGGL